MWAALRITEAIEDLNEATAHLEARPVRSRCLASASQAAACRLSLSESVSAFATVVHRSHRWILPGTARHMPTSAAPTRNFPRSLPVGDLRRPPTCISTMSAPGISGTRRSFGVAEPPVQPASNPLAILQPGRSWRSN